MENQSSVVETDFRVYWLTVKHALERIPDSGSIINISSNRAFSTMPGIFPYNAIKAGINGVTRGFVLELGPPIFRSTPLIPVRSRLYSLMEDELSSWRTTRSSNTRPAFGDNNASEFS